MRDHREDPPSSGLARWPVLLAHDYLLVMRGAERTFQAIAECWPRAPIATLLYDEAGTGGLFRHHRIITSPLQSLPVRQRGFRAMLPLFPLAAGSLNLPDTRLLISSSSAFAHGFRAAPGTTHVCYCHSPFRYVYHERRRAIREVPPIARPALARVLAEVRRWEDRAAQRPTAYIANSKTTRQRIWDYWQREATVVHPPVEVERFHRAQPEDYFLVVCELVPHKRVDVALEAARLVRRPIVVVGDGPDRPRLEALYGDRATFLGRVGDVQLADLYARTLALVVPNVEDFGIASVEAQAAGRPVIGLGIGGTEETVIDGETGVLVPSPWPERLAEAMAYDDFERFDPERIQRHAARFSSSEFRRKLIAEVRRVTGADAVAADAPPPVPEPVAV